MGTLFSPLVVMVWVPFLGALLVGTLPREAEHRIKWSALLVSGLVFAIGVIAAASFDWSGAAPWQLSATAPWIPALGISFRFGADAISMSLILLTAFIMPLTLLGSFGDVHERVKEFYVWHLILLGALVGVFAATDLILFYLFFELTLVPLFFLIGIYGGAERHYAALKFFIFTLAGSLLTLAGLLYVAWFNAALDPVEGTKTGQWTFDITTLYIAAREMSASEQGWVLAALLAGFAVKVPLFPVHTWLPLAHTEAPTSGSVVLAGVLLKLGTYGLVRFALPMTPDAVVNLAPVIGALSVVGILYAALICWVQQDLKRLIAYSSISHLGFCVLGLFALNAAGVGGSVIYMINHGLATGALFLCAGMIQHRYHTRDMDELGGLGKRLPVWSTFMVIFCLASVGLPGLNGFVGEFLTLLGAFTATDTLGVAFAAAGAGGLILAAIYILYMVGKVVLGPVKEPADHAGRVPDLNGREIVTLTPLAAACLFLGLFPFPLLRSYESAIGRLPEVYKIEGVETAQAPEEEPRRAGRPSSRNRFRSSVAGSRPPFEEIAVARPLKAGIGESFLPSLATTGSSVPKEVDR